MNYFEKSIKLHAQHQGKIEIHNKIEVNSSEDLLVVYSPGVAEPCR